MAAKTQGRDFRQALEEYSEKKYPGDGPHLISCEIDPNEPKLRHGDMFGNWQYDARNKCIEYIGPTHYKGYWIGLSRISTPAQLGEWCLHMCVKNWITTEDLGNLVYAIHYIQGLSR